jgi:hypothetical protein
MEFEFEFEFGKYVCANLLSYNLLSVTNIRYSNGIGYNNNVMMMMGVCSVPVCQPEWSRESGVWSLESRSLFARPSLFLGIGMIFFWDDSFFAARRISGTGDGER